MNKMIPICVVCAVAVAVTPAVAGEIDGSVRDSSGVPVAGATVRIQGSDHTTTTDAHGHFHFDDLRPMEYRVEVEGDGVAAAGSVTVGDGLSSMRLRLDAIALDRIVVRASPLRGRSPLDMAQPVTVLGGDELTRKSASSIGETVAAELGMSSTSFGQGASRPVIRGLGDDRVRVLEGGIGTLDVSSVSDDHGVTIEPVLVDQVEILRGPATLLYGSGAIGGVVNVVDNRIPERLPAHVLEGRAESRGATVNDERTGLVRLDGRASSNLAWHFDAYRRETGDIEIPESAGSTVLHNSDLLHRGGALGLSWIGDRGFLGLSVSTMDNRYGIPGGHAHDEDAEEEEEIKIDQDQTRLDLAGSLSDPVRGFDLLRFRFGINDYEHVEIEGAEVGTVFENDAWEGRLELNHAPTLGGWRGAIGVQASDRAFAAIGTEAFTPPVDSSESGLFLVEERDFGRLRVEIGGRIGRVVHDPAAGVKRSYTLTGYSSGLIVPLANETEFVVNLGRFQRAPVAEELYSDGPHLATGTFERGDADLGRERSTAFELTLRDGRGDLRWTVNAFRNDFDRFIHLADTAQVDPESALPVFRYAQQDAEFVGVEAEITGRLADSGPGGLDLRVFTDRVRATFADGTPVPRIPPRRVGLALEYSRDAWFARLDWTRHGGQDRVAPGESPTPGFDLLTADLNHRLQSGAVEWLLFLRGTNLLDEDARRHSSFLKDVAPLPGRGVQIGARVAF